MGGGKGAHWGPAASYTVSLFGLLGAMAWARRWLWQGLGSEQAAPSPPPGTQSRDGMVKETEVD